MAADRVSFQELLLWTKRFSVMIEMGVSLMRSLKALAEEETTLGMKDITCALMDKIEGGAILSDAMRSWPHVFDDNYISSIRVGEIGGILQITLKRQVEHLERAPSRSNLEKNQISRWDLAEWFWRFGQMLEAGVPLLFALETLANLTKPSVLQQISHEIYDEIQSGISLVPELKPELKNALTEELPVIWRYTEIFTPTIKQMLETGQFSVPLWQTLSKAAKLLEWEAQLESEGKLPPLYISISDEKKPKIDSDVVRQVNEMFQTAINTKAELIRISYGEDECGEAVLDKRGEIPRSFPLRNYKQAIRRIKVMAGMDPLAHVNPNGEIHLRYQEEDYIVTVYQHPTGLIIHLKSDQQAVQL